MVLMQYVPAGQDVTFNVGGKARLARVVAPSTVKGPAPIVICFHGGGGRAYFAVDEYAIQKFWPEALVYYAQGETGSGGYSTWGPGDLGFYDALRADAVHHRGGDPKRLFLMGYSTGANFASEIWSKRAAQITGLALVSGGVMKTSASARPVYLSYGKGEPSARRLAAFAEFLRRRGAPVEIVATDRSHTYPQNENEKMIAFLRGCPALP